MKRTKSTFDAESYYQKQKSFSYILTPSQPSSMSRMLETSSKSALQNELLEIRGDKEGRFWNANKQRWEASKIACLKQELSDLEGDFKRLQRQRVNEGYQPLTEWPPDLDEFRQKIQTRLRIANEEVEHLEELLKAVREKQPDLPPIKPRRFWSSGNLQGGVLVDIGGIQIKPDKTGLLRICDERSPYDTMPVWRFRGQVVGPMFWEDRFRYHQEEKLSKKEGRPFKTPPFPALPRWDRTADIVEYPSDYSIRTINRVKKAMK